MAKNADIIEAAIVGLQHRREQLDAKIADLRQQLGGEKNGPGRGTFALDGNEQPARTKPRRRQLSKQTRARMAEGQRKRWATRRNRSR